MAAVPLESRSVRMIRVQRVSTSVSIRSIGVTRGVTSRGLTNHRDKITGEMCLVGVAEFGGEPGPIDRSSRRHSSFHLVQPVVPDDPFRSDTHVLGEEPLQAPHAESGPVGEGAHAGDVGLRGNSRHNASHRCCSGIAGRQMRQQVALDERSMTRTSSVSSAAPAIACSGRSGPNTARAEIDRPVIVETGAFRNGRKHPGRKATPNARPVPSSVRNTRRPPTPRTTGPASPTNDRCTLSDGTMSWRNGG